MKTSHEKLKHLNRIIRDMNSALDINDFFNSITKYIISMIGAKKSIFLLVNKEQNTIIQRAVEGYSEDHLNSITFKEIEQGISGHVIKTKKAIISDNAQEHPKNMGIAKENAIKFGTRAILVAPIIVDNDAIGTLTACNDTDDPFSENDLQLIEMLADQASIAVKRSRLLEQTDSLHRFAKIISESILADNLLKSLSILGFGLLRALHCESVIIGYIMNSDNIDKGRNKICELIFLKGYYITREKDTYQLLKEILNQDTLIIIEDISKDPLFSSRFGESTKTCITIPLKYMGKDDIGVLFVFYPINPNLLPEMLSDIKLFANQAAFIIQNALLKEKKLHQNNSTSIEFPKRKTMSKENFDAFVEAYNNFDSRPLKGEYLQKYYLEDITQDVTNSIIKTIKITEKYRKILIIGHTGCGKSTVLNKVADELKDIYHIVSFSVADELNMMDVETIDILLTIYMQLIYSMKDREITPLLNKYETFMKSLKDKLKITETGVDVIKSVSYKIKVESETRDTVREALNTQAEQLQNNLSEACEEISRIIQKDVLVIIDDLDKLKDEFAEKIFCNEPHLLTTPEAKIIFTFPLSLYYSPSFVQKVTDKFTHKFIRLVDLHDIEGKYKEDSLIMLKNMVLKRIDEKHVTDKALKNLVDKSGGLVRDLIKLMQEACGVVIDEELSLINEDVSWKVIHDKINEYNRIFDFPKYKNDIIEIMGTQNKDEIENENLIYLLRYLFVLEYGRRGQESWFDVHPCLKECFSRRNL